MENELNSNWIPVTFFSVTSAAGGTEWDRIFTYKKNTKLDSVVPQQNQTQKGEKKNWIIL